jgi:hypothetical protein
MSRCQSASLNTPATSSTKLVPHPIATLFPDLPPADFAALKEDIRAHGMKIPILTHGGLILDGRQRHRACQELGIQCRSVEWNGHVPWFEVQSRNLLRRHLAREQVCAIQQLAAQQFPELATPVNAACASARARKAQAKGKPRGEKAEPLTGSRDSHRKSADAVGAQIGVSGSTVIRVNRLAREAPHLLHRVAAGELSVKRALRSIAPADAADGRTDFVFDRAVTHTTRIMREAFLKCPREERRPFLLALDSQLQRLLREEIGLRLPGVEMAAPPSEYPGVVRGSCDGPTDLSVGGSARG